MKTFIEILTKLTIIAIAGFSLIGFAVLMVATILKGIIIHL